MIKIKLINEAIEQSSYDKIKPNMRTFMPRPGSTGENLGDEEIKSRLHGKRNPPSAFTEKVPSKIENVPRAFKRDILQRTDMKPKGLWYGFGTEWVDWVRAEMPSWESDSIYELVIDDSKVLKLTDDSMIDEFTNIYGVRDNRFPDLVPKIRWQDVAEKYTGIEINPYSWEARANHSWYYGWDIASGCIWGANVLKGSRKL